MINDIYNGDSASDIRAKLNELIKIVNDYSSSQYMDAGPGPDPGSEGTTIYVSDMASAFPESTSENACNAYNTGYSHTVYLQKDPMNMGGTIVPELNDYVYDDNTQTNYLSQGYYGYYSDSEMTAKYFEVSMNGQIISIGTCTPTSGAEGGMITIWSNSQGSPTPEITPEPACSTINMGYSNTVYIQKDAANLAGGSVPEAGDFLYEDISYTMPLAQGNYGWYDDNELYNKFIEIGAAGVIVQVNYCA